MWKPVNSESELIEGAKIRYMTSDNPTRYGEDDSPRSISNRWGIWEAFNADLHLAGTAFTEMKNPEIWIEDSPKPESTPTPEPVKKSEPSKPVHMGYEWDGIRYVNGKIGLLTLEEHDKKIEGLKAELKLLQLQKSRYLDLVKKGM